MTLERASPFLNPPDENKLTKKTEYLPTVVFKTLTLAVAELSAKNVSLLEEPLLSLQLWFVTVSIIGISISFVVMVLILWSSTSITFTKQLLFLMSPISAVLLGMSDSFGDKGVATSFTFVGVVSGM